MPLWVGDWMSTSRPAMPRLDERGKVVTDESPRLWVLGWRRVRLVRREGLLLAGWNNLMESGRSRRRGGGRGSQGRRAGNGWLQASGIRYHFGAHLASLRRMRNPGYFSYQTEEIVPDSGLH